MPVNYRKPIVIENGELEQIQSGDGMDIGPFQLPAAMGNATQVLAVPVAGTLLEWVNPDTGPQGPQGNQGNQGFQGTSGANGANGANGASGVDAITLTNDNAGSIVICQATYTKANGHVDLAQANAVGTKEVLGLVLDVTIPSANAGQIQFDGILAANTADWDNVTGNSGGLTPGAVYFLSDGVPGGLTVSAPTVAGNYVARVGKAVSATQMNIKIQTPIKL